jgi:hypothetical protein
MMTCVIVNMPPTTLERKMFVLSATPFVWVRALVPELRCRLLNTQARAQTLAGLLEYVVHKEATGTYF